MQCAQKMTMDSALFKTVATIFGVMVGQVLTGPCLDTDCSNSPAIQLACLLPCTYCMDVNEWCSYIPSYS